MASADHIIQKQVFEVEMENPADAFQFRNRLGEVFHEKILPAMEVLFNEVGVSRTFRIDKLEIDLGNINKANWEDELRDKAMAKMRQQLLVQNPMWTDPFTQTTTPEDAEIENDVVANFIYFLSTGRLPWHSKDSISFEKHLKEQLSPQLIKALRKFLETTDSISLTRLIYQLSDDLLLNLLERLLPDEEYSFAGDFRQAANYISVVFKSLKVPDLHARKVLFLPLFGWFSLGANRKPFQFYASAFLEAMQPAYPEVKKYFYLAAAPAMYHDNPILKQIEQQLLPVAIKKRTNNKPLVQDTKKQTTTDEDIYIQNAGLVMLHPFLAPLFTHLNLLEKGKFVNEAAQMKAVLLSQYLVDDSTETEEHQLVLNKLLCGMPLQMPIIKKLELSEKEKAEADDLLNQVTKLWTKNNTPVNGTIQGLQQSFLQRNGKLQQQDLNWRLQVEQKAYDMLLSSLPWGISIIKNSWMEGMIWVEWGR